MSKLTNQWIDLFRAGDYSSVDKGVFTDADLDQIVNNYDPAHYEAPSTFGHPKKNDSAPAYGWWSKLRRVGDLLQGQMGKVQPEFEEAVERELYKKRSVGLAKDKAKGWMLHHVAWLGAQAPQIKGLADFKFEDQQQDSIEIEFSEDDMAAEMNQDKVLDGLWDRLVAHACGKKPETPAAKTFSEDDMKRFASEAVTAALKTELEPMKKEFADAQKHSATVATKSRAAEAIAKLKTDGKWIPAYEKMGVPAIFEELATSTTTIEFGEEDATTKKKPQVSPLEIAVKFFEGLKKIVPNDPIFTGQAATATTETLKGHNPNGRASVDPNSAELDRQVRVHMSEKNVDYSTALTAVIAAKPELAKPGGSAAGQV